jgi:hypothetical protein
MSQEFKEEAALRRRSLINRALYQQKAIYSAEAPENAATQYLGYDAATGMGKLKTSSGDQFFGNAITNGAIAAGDMVRMRGGRYDAMGRIPQTTISEPPEIKTTGGLIITRDVNWLNIDNPVNEDTFSRIIKPLMRMNAIYTIEPTDERIYSAEGVIFGLLPSLNPPYSIASNVRKVLQAGKISVKGINLGKDYKKIKGLIVVPLFSPNAVLSSAEIRILVEVAQNNLVWILSEWSIWRGQSDYLLSEFKLSKITTGSDYTNGVNWINTKSNKIGKRMSGQVLRNNATGTFIGATEKQKLFVIAEDRIPFSTTIIPAGTATAIYIEAKDLK